MKTSAASGIEAKPYAVEAQRLAILDSQIRKGYKNAIVKKGKGTDIWTVEHPVIGEPKVSIVIPTKDQFELIKKCVDSIIEKTTYKNFEIVLVDTGSTDKKVWSWYEGISKKGNISVVKFKEQPFNYYKSCNYGVSKFDGEYIVLLNNDMELITQRWIEILLGDA